jgi:hypothetical protein
MLIVRMRLSRAVGIITAINTTVAALDILPSGIPATTTPGAPI